MNQSKVTIDDPDAYITTAWEFALNPTASTVAATNFELYGNDANCK